MESIFNKVRSWVGGDARCDDNKNNVARERHLLWLSAFAFHTIRSSIAVFAEWGGSEGWGEIGVVVW